MYFFIFMINYFEILMLLVVWILWLLIQCNTHNWKQFTVTKIRTAIMEAQVSVMDMKEKK